MANTITAGRRAVLAAALTAGLAAGFGAGPAAAQRSLFDEPATNLPAVPPPSAPAPAPSAPVPAAAAPAVATPPAAATAIAQPAAKPAGATGPGDAVRPEEAARPAAAARPKRAAKPKGPTPARSLSVNNAASSTLTALEVSGDGKTAKLSKPLKANGRTTLKLPALKTCSVTVTSTLEGGQPAENELDICKEKAVRITDG